MVDKDILLTKWALYADMYQNDEPLRLTSDERRQLAAFLRTLSGPILVGGRDAREVSR